MISRRAKAAFYACAGPLMTANGWIWRHFRTPKVEGDLMRVQRKRPVKSLSVY